MTEYGILGDWGTTRLRLFRMVDGSVVDRREGPGIGALPAAPETVLRDAIAPWLADGEPRSIALTGMVGSRNGWHEVPYVACPASVADWAAGGARLALDGVPVTIAAGLAQSGDTPPDVMRGEETQLFGAVAAYPELARGRRSIVLPGTHSKWAVIEDGRIVAFRTFLTGELFALLRTQSTLLRVDAETIPDDGTGFAAGLDRAAAGADLLGTMFEARSAQLLGGRSAGWAAGFLSGLLIGSEIAGVPDRGADVAIIGDPALAARYETALAKSGTASRVLDADRCVLAGLALLETHA